MSGDRRSTLNDQSKSTSLNSRQRSSVAVVASSDGCGDINQN